MQPARARQTLDLQAALRDCAAGDRAALRQIYELEAPRMLGVALRILRRRSLAEEAVHDTFMQLWRKAGTYDPLRGDPRSWLYTLLRNRSLNILRGETRTDLVDNFEPMALESGEENPEDVVARLSESDALRRCLERLDPVRRNAIVLAYLHGLTHEELASRMKVPLGTMKSWLRRSLLSLRECLQ